MLLEHIDVLLADGRITLDAMYGATLIQYRSVIRLSMDFYIAMRSNPRKDPPFPHAALARLLEEITFLPATQ